MNDLRIARLAKSYEPSFLAQMKAMVVCRSRQEARGAPKAQ